MTGCTSFYGEVLAVDSKSINIRGQEEGLPVEKVTRYFPAGAALRKGEQEPLEKTSWDYRLSDVKVGDIVVVVIHIYGDEHECVTICIRRRPGGAVPKAPFEAPGVPIPHHEMMNAYQRFEEKGIPLPLKFDPDYQRALSEATAAENKKILERFSAEERKRSEGRIAPLPRQVLPELKFPLSPSRRGPAVS
jgi:hypothetical protein